MQTADKKEQNDELERLAYKLKAMERDHDKECSSLQQRIDAGTAKVCLTGRLLNLLMCMHQPFILMPS